MKYEIFKQEDFVGSSWFESAKIANEKLNKLIESWPVVYGKINTDHILIWDKNSAYYNNTHRARLAFAEPISKECEHSAEMRQDYTPEWIVSVNQQGKIVCKHCGIELQAVWSEKK